VGHPRPHAWRSGRLASRRFRRRLVLAAVVVVVVVGGAAAVIVGNTAPPPLPVTKRAAIVERKRKPVRLTPADRKTILAVSREFIATAVERKHPERAWPLATDALRSGTTLADWKAGTLPIPPYPVRTARWNFAYSVVGEVGLDVLVEPSDPELDPLVHRLTLVPSKRPAGPAWLVDGWVPMSSSSFGAADALPSGLPSGSDDALPPRSTPDPGRYWVLAPFVIVIAALLIPFVIMVNSRRAERRIRRRRSAV
jgi:hypothetical protein